MTRGQAQRVRTPRERGFARQVARDEYSFGLAFNRATHSLRFTANHGCSAPGKMGFAQLGRVNSLAMRGASPAR